jgi:hypothetical protein
MQNLFVLAPNLKESSIVWYKIHAIEINGPRNLDTAPTRII